MRVLVVCLLVVAEGVALADTALLVELSQERTAVTQVAALTRDLETSGHTLVTGRQAMEVREAVPSPPTWDDSRAALDQARAAYESLELEEASGALGNFDARVPARVVDTEGLQLLADRYLLEGLVELGSGDKEHALEAFRLAHRFQPGRSSLDPGQYRPAVVELYQRAVKANLGARKVALERTWRPSDALLVVDGSVSDPAEVTTGPHHIVLARRGYERATMVEDIGPRTRIEVALENRSRWLVLRDDLIAEDEPSLEALTSFVEEVRVDLLVLMRDGRVSLFRAGDSAASEWKPIASLNLHAALSARKAPGPKVVSEEDGDKPPEAAWYRSWWGTSLLAAGGGAVVGTALYFFLSSREDSGGQAMITQWCDTTCP